MTREKIFNLFIFFENGVANEVGGRFHKLSGDDFQKQEFLKCNVKADFPNAVRVSLPRAFTPEEWRSQQRIGNVLAFFEEYLSKSNAPKAPLFGITAIVDGKPKIDQTIDSDTFRGEDVTGFKRKGEMPDYLVEYTTGNRFHLDRLINDDYFEAIKCLFNAGKYVSMAKLLMSCVDTLAYVEHGDKSKNFVLWLNEYCELEKLGITSEELWEFRNSVLHMTNLSSRKVLKGDCARITPFIAGLDMETPGDTGDEKPFNLYALVHEVAAGVSRWGATYNEHPEKSLKFIERYDTTISDARLAQVPISPSAASSPEF
ncbi:hypothetical protein JQT66_09300 [Sulfitobacter mediterraneus]|uniref:hypothetical protein n=1 Tax=Sulfitobacter mediterraneus TaxID=83219 RepID=UPI001933E04E|nr:hypothetical protein [Sulfitobacter mediterraneus]MBM1310360.1 hypothetical protein [Sulfitobacter mediterraneus]MBM1314244.1 hypothetical protein [Sulfitobacter mediterraneus]MBM1322604.1 hypothetical protein [Sulfitobacter mediterraneus]MBM1326516.1 hypothetical protein [Sulfitobacter mediterraneus]MBM1397862.1 hypothetical protein [Sulfitobacter mediterraneus]